MKQEKKAMPEHAHDFSIGLMYSIAGILNTAFSGSSEYSILCATLALDKFIDGAYDLYCEGRFKKLIPSFFQQKPQQTEMETPSNPLRYSF